MGLGKERSNECPSYTGSKLRLDRKARNFPSGVKAGEASRKRPSVTSTGSASSLSTVASRSRLREPKDVTGSDQASQRESADQASSEMLPSPMLATCEKLPLRVSTTCTSPKEVPRATQRPSGLASRELARAGVGTLMPASAAGA